MIRVTVSLRERKKLVAIDIMGINKLTALDTEKQDARRNYNTAKADYEREYRGFPFKGLHVRWKESIEWT